MNETGRKQSRWIPEEGVKNLVFLGEAGCGKSEAAVNAAMELAASQDRQVHFFDMDMTKPLFRSRDVCQQMEQAGITVHFEQQFMDAPTMVGGLQTLLEDDSSLVIMDVGGNDTGARAIGGYVMSLRRPHTAVWYMVNPYRPWSADLEHIDGTLSAILGVSHLQIANLHFLGNPNLGVHTTADEVRQGIEKLREMFEGTVELEGFCVHEDLISEMDPELDLLPLRLYLTYEWELED